MKSATEKQEIQNVTDFTEKISGARNGRSLGVTLVLFFAGLGFFLAGLSSYFQRILLPFNDTSKLSFFPQGMTMLFYGSMALGVSLYLSATLFWDVGSGYNLYSKTTQSIRLIRLGFPGKQREIFLSYELQTIKNLKFFFKQGLNPRATIYLILKDEREIPLYPAQFLVSPLEIERKAIQLSQYLNLPLESQILE
jgi:hypothetical protein